MKGSTAHSGRCQETNNQRLTFLIFPGKASFISVIQSIESCCTWTELNIRLDHQARWRWPWKNVWRKRPNHSWSGLFNHQNIPASWWLNQPISKNKLVKLNSISPRFGVTTNSIWNHLPVARIFNLLIVNVYDLTLNEQLILRLPRLPLTIGFKRQEHDYKLMYNSPWWWFWVLDFLLQNLRATCILLCSLVPFLMSLVSSAVGLYLLIISLYPEPTQDEENSWFTSSIDLNQ